MERVTQFGSVANLGSPTPSTHPISILQTSTASGELHTPPEQTHTSAAPRQNLARIDELIQRTDNLNRLKLLNRLWWKEWFRVYCHN